MVSLSFCSIIVLKLLRCTLVFHLVHCLLLNSVPSDQYWPRDIGQVLNRQSCGYFTLMHFTVVFCVNNIAGPLPRTYGDFWHMVWEQAVLVVVMVTR